MQRFLKWALLFGNAESCWPWNHTWIKTRVAVVPLDSSRGELWRCQNCPVVKAK